MSWAGSTSRSTSGAIIAHRLARVLRLALLNSVSGRVSAYQGSSSAILIDPDSTPSTMSARSEEHTSELQSLMRISYAVFCLNKTNKHTYHNNHKHNIIKN